MSELFHLIIAIICGGGGIVGAAVHVNKAGLDFQRGEYGAGTINLIIFAAFCGIAWFGVTFPVGPEYGEFLPQ